MIKKVILCLGIIMSVCSPVAYASENLDSVVVSQETYLPNNGEDFTTTTQEEVESKATYITVYDHDYTKGSAKKGSWRDCTSAYGPGNLQCNRSHDKSYNVEFTASVGGSYENGAGIEGALGITLGASKSYSLGAGFSTDVASGKHVTIQYRPVYYNYKVVETKYKEAYIAGLGMHRVELGKKTAYVDVFSHWEFRPY